MRNYLNWKYENFTITFRPLVSSVIMPGAWERSVLCQSIIAPCVSPSVDWLTLRPLTDWGRPRTGPQLSPFWPAATSCDVIPCHPACQPASQIIIAFQNWHKHHRCQICWQKSQACIAIKLIYLALLIWASPITKYNRYHILVHQVERGKFSFESFEESIIRILIVSAVCPTESIQQNLKWLLAFDKFKEEPDTSMIKHS